MIYNLKSDLKMVKSGSQDMGYWGRRWGTPLRFPCQVINRPGVAGAVLQAHVSPPVTAHMSHVTCNFL